MTIVPVSEFQAYGTKGAIIKKEYGVQVLNKRHTRKPACRLKSWVSLNPRREQLLVVSHHAIAAQSDGDDVNPSCVYLSDAAPFTAKCGMIKFGRYFIRSARKSREHNHPAPPGCRISLVLARIIW